MNKNEMYIEVAFLGQWDGKNGKFEGQRIYFYETDISDIFSLLTLGGNFFRIIPEWAIYWNTYINDEWGGLDDCDYYAYDKPIMTNDYQWNTYYAGHTCTLKEYKNYLATELVYVKKFSELAN